MTWMTPFEAVMSVLTTLALFPCPSVSTTPLLSTAAVNDAPLTVLTGPDCTSLAITVPGTTWYFRMAASFCWFSGFSSESSVPAGSLANASLVGAKTVKGPVPDRVSASPAAFTALTSVVKSGLAAAMSTMVCEVAAALVAVAPLDALLLLLPLLLQAAMTMPAAARAARTKGVLWVRKGRSWGEGDVTAMFDGGRPIGCTPPGIGAGATAGAGAIGRPVLEMAPSDQGGAPVSVDRLSPLDASFLHIEDHVSHMHIASVAIFEGPEPPFEDVVTMVRGKLPLVPRYRQVVRFVPLDLGRPVWVDDPHFNLDYHVRHTALPAPGGEAELRKLVGRVMSQQLDRTKPLWEIWVVQGLEDGRWATLSKTHHAMVDGVSGTDLLTVIMDSSPRPSRRVPDHWRPEPSPSGAQLASDAIAGLIRSPYEQLRAVRAATRVPRQALSQLAEVARGMSAMAGLARPTPVSTLNGPIGPHRRYAWASTCVDDIKTVRKHHGGTFNDVVLAAITRGFRDLLLSRGEPVDRVVRTLVPVSVRPRDAAGRAVGDGTLENKVSAMFAELPVGLDDPVERLHAVTAQMEGLKESKEAIAGEALTSLSGFAPPMLLALGMRLAGRMAQRNINTVTTNVPGPQAPLYAAGRRMLKAYPYVPLAGQVRIGVAIFSYDGQVNFGVTGDHDTTPDLDVLCRGIEAGMDELLALSA